MPEYLRNEANKTFTQNGASSYISSQSFCLDFFYLAGALRDADEKRIILIFSRAFAEDPDICLKILFFARDIRGGLGERRLFRICLRWLAENYPSRIVKNLKYIGEFGRYDDILCLLDTPCRNSVTELISDTLKKDIKAVKEQSENISLLAKWLPSVNTSNAEAVKTARDIARATGMSQAVYRKTLSGLRRYIDIIENRLRKTDYTFDYSKQTSRALFKYKKAFVRNDADRYRKFIADAAGGKAKINTGTLYPYDIIREALSSDQTPEQRAYLDAAWNNLESCEGNNNSIAVIDGSGSMYCSMNSPKPYEAALSLGIYFAQHTKGKFHDHFITFSQNPRLIKITGSDISEKAQFAAGFNEVANTNIEAVFDLILKTAVKYSLPQSELPDTVYIFSDMEFDRCVRNGSLTNFENAKAGYKGYGYKLPGVVFWNVNSKTQQVPVRMHDSGAALVSGSSPKIFDMVKKGELEPLKMMLDIICAERYSVISA
ncbi:MAG: DUF2828 family protein [Oscillospiraceae bacterium]|nr:DUF2828 family protein [Oscillospiraceae bacterium]